MPVILSTDRRGWSARLTVWLIYLLLITGGLTMVFPFLITFTGSLAGRFDYYRFAPWPRSWFSREDRFVRSLEPYFQLRISSDVFQDRPEAWGSWIGAGRNLAEVDRFAAPYLNAARDPVAWPRWQRMAADYAAFNLDYDIRDTTCYYDFRDVAAYVRRTYEQRVLATQPDAKGLSRRSLSDAALALLCREWGVPYRSFFDIGFWGEIWYPMHHVTWNYPDTAKARAYLDMKEAYRTLQFRPGAQRQWAVFLRDRGIDGAAAWPVTRADAHWDLFKEFAGRQSPATPTMPFLLKPEWIRFLNRPETRQRLGLDPQAVLGIADYNRLFHADCRDLNAIPFPVPDDAPAKLQEVWRQFVRDYYPRRLMRVRPTPELETAYQEQLRASCHTIANYNRLMGTQLARFEDLRLPAYENSDPWRSFVSQVPFANLEHHSAEASFQQFLLARYGALAHVNAAYGWSLRRIEEARIPIAEAITVTFVRNEWPYYLNDMWANYRVVLDFMFVRGRAFFNTFILVILTILATLTVNPIAAYALSRYRLRWTEQILLFLLATMAFPAAVQAIPGFLLMRDLHLLNSFPALILPGLGNGMAIFILKSFFDGLPRELYEAATIDGAREWQIFLHITLPMTTPILAVNTLNAFMQAYNSWEWALLVCQKQDYWTLAVLLYQMSNNYATLPYVVMAGFVVASIPTAIVFISCQKIILRGIVIPSMK